MNKSIVIWQPNGIGDILFCIPLAREFLKKYKEVIWPTDDKYIWIRDYVDDIKYITKAKMKEMVPQFNIEWSGGNFFENKAPCEAAGFDYLPLRFAAALTPGVNSPRNTMVDKYKLGNVPLNKWRTLRWIRNRQKEELLFNSLGLGSKKYNLINTNFAAPGNNINIKVKNQ